MPEKKRPPDDYKILYEGPPLPPFYVAEMVRPLIGKTIWIKDAAERMRNGMVSEVPWIKEEQTTNLPALKFADDRPLFFKDIVLIAVYDPMGKRGE